MSKKFSTTIALTLLVVVLFLTMPVPPARAEGGAIGALGEVAFGAGGAGGYIIGGLAQFVVRLATPIVGILMKILGGFMNWSMQITGSFIEKDGSMVSIGWEIMRDLVNVCFIFILLFISIATILGVGLKNYGMKKALAMVIVMALLVNFSKVFCEQLIHFSYLLTNFFLTESGVTQGQLSEHIMSQLSVTKAFQASRDFGNNWLEAGVNVGIAGVMNLIVLTAVLIFLALGCLMLLIRVVALFILTIVSPVAFLCRAIPYKGAQTLWKKWWQNLMNYVLFAPAFAFFVYLALLFPKTINDVKIASLTGGAGTTVKTDTMTVPTLGNQFFASADLLIKYAITLGLLFAGLYMAQRLSLQSGETIFSWAKSGMEKSSKWIGKASLKGGGTAYRQTIGRGLNWGGQKLSKRGGRIGKVGDALQGAGVISIPYAKRKAMASLERVPIVGKAVGGPGAYKEKEQKAINSKASDLKDRDEESLRRIANQTTVTNENLVEAAAALKVLADQGKLKDKDKKLVDRYRKAGGDVGDILQGQPDWIEELAPELYLDEDGTLKEEIRQLKEDLKESLGEPTEFAQKQIDKLNQEIRYLRQTATGMADEEGDIEEKEEKIRQLEQQTMTSEQMESFAQSTAINQYFLEKKKPHEAAQINAKLLDKEEVREAVTQALKKGGWTKKHVAKILASDNEKLIKKMEDIFEENRESLPKELREYWDSKASQLAFLLERIEEGESEEGEEGEEE